MLSRRNRAPVSLLLRGRLPIFYSSPFFKLLVGQNSLGHNRFGVVVSVAVDLRATERHRLKRVLIEAVREWPAFSSDFVFIVGKRARGVSRELLRLEVDRALAAATKLSIINR